MTFMELLLSAKLGSTSAFEELFARYKNLLRKYSVVNGIFDEDLYQEQCVLFAHCIEIFDVNRIIENLRHIYDVTEIFVKRAHL